MGELRFIGAGGFNNYKLGNTSAYFIEGDSLFLLDCGCDVFKKIHQFHDREFNRVKNIYVMISHIHDDHVGSLTSLIFHSFYFYKKKVIVLNNNQKDLISLIKKHTGSFSRFNSIKNTDAYGWIQIETTRSTVKIKYMNTHHVPYMKSYGFLISIERNEGTENFYYSGDSNYIPKFVLSLLHDDATLNAIYQDTTCTDFENNPHLSLNKLKELIAPELRHKVFCMHRDMKFDYKEAERAGFKMAENYIGE